MINEINKNNNYLKYIYLSFQILFLLIVSAFIGNFLDTYFKFNFPLLIFLFPLLSFFGYMYKLYSLLIK